MAANGMLSPADHRLCDAYVAVGVRPADLAYTDAMEDLARRAGYPKATRDDLHFLYARTVTLRSYGWLPRVP